VLPPALPASAFVPSMPRLLPSLFPVALQLRLTPPVLARLHGAAFEAASADLVFAPLPVLPGGEGRVLGPRRSVGFAPLRGRSFAPVLKRSVRRWLERRSTRRPGAAPRPVRVRSTSTNALSPGEPSPALAREKKVLDFVD